MKKIALAAALAALTSTAFAGGSVGLGYQVSTVAPNYGDCWAECFGDAEPAGFAVNASYDILPSVFVNADYSNLVDEEDFYSTDIIPVEIEQTRMAVGAGYRHTLNDNSNLTAAVQFSSFEWDYDWGDPGNVWHYNAEDDGVSLVVGANTKLSERASTGASLSAGFETGISAYVSVKLSDNVALQTSYSRVAYELGDFSRTINGVVNGSPQSANGDGDYQFNDENFRVSVNYQF